MERLLRNSVMAAALAVAAAFPSLAFTAATAGAGEAVGAHVDGDAQKAIAAGADAYRHGAVEASVEALSDALQGRLTSRQRGEALYYRGLAYRALGKPGYAISDLTNALNIESGLSDAQRTDAKFNRAHAYSEAGITAAESVVVESSERAPTGAALSPPAEPSRSRPLTTASIAAGDPATSGWGAATDIAAPFTPQLEAPPSPPLHEPSASPQAIRLQVGRARSRSEAYALAVRVTSQHGRAFGVGNLRIEQRNDGSEPVWLVQVGPYTDPIKAEQLCAMFRRTHLDCVIQYGEQMATQATPVNHTIAGALP
jgi:hypothetical protein